MMKVATKQWIEYVTFGTKDLIIQSYMYANCINRNALIMYQNVFKTIIKNVNQNINHYIVGYDAIMVFFYIIDNNENSIGITMIDGG